MLLRKTLAFADCQIHIKAEGAALQFGGYASVFGGNDTYNDTILPGAFADTLKQNGLPRMFYGHKWDLPIGKYLTAKEDDTGLWVEGEITPGMSRATDIAAALKHGTLDGLSVGGFVKSSDAEAKAAGGRLIRKWTRLVEVSPVVFPADGAARIDLASVKGEDLTEALDGLSTVTDFQLFLRDALGLAGPAAAQLIQRAQAVFSGKDQGADTQKQQEELAQALFLRRLRRAAGNLPTQS